jgi:hypothetical protein
MGKERIALGAIAHRSSPSPAKPARIPVSDDEPSRKWGTRLGFLVLVKLTCFFRPLAEDRVANLARQVHGVFSVSGWTKIRTIRHNDRVTDVVSVEACKIAFRFFVGNGGEAYWADGVERAISI